MSDIDKARGYFYEMFAKSFELPSEDGFEILAKQIDFLSDYALNDEQKLAFDELKKVDFNRFKIEQNAIFYDFSFANVPLSASFYDEGVENGKMRVKAGDLIAKSKFRANDNTSEDELGVIFAFCGATLQNEDEELANEMFKEVLNEVVDEFIQKFSKKDGSVFFDNLAVVMRVFFDYERILLDVKAPVHEYSKADIALSKTPYTPKMPTKFSKINLEEVTEFKGMD